MDRLKKGANRVMFFSDNTLVINEFEEIVKKRNPKNEFIRIDNILNITDHLNDSSYSKPDIIIMDIQLENIIVFNIVNRIKNSIFKYIPLLLIKKESDENTILQFYYSYVNCFIMKPDESGKIFEILKSIDEFWLEVVNLPQIHTN